VPEKKIIKDIIGKDGVKLLSIIKKLITETHNKERAKEVENDIIRISVKIILLYRNENISNDELTQLKPRVQRLWHIVQDYANIINFDYNSTAVQDSANNFFNVLLNMLNGLISEKNLQKVRDINELLFSTETLDYLFTNENSIEKRKLLAHILEKYYNFN